MPLADKLRESGVTFPQNKPRGEPLWRGPLQDGITFSLLSRFLVCRERFRLLVMEGLKPEDTFNHRIEYGQMWHVCEEALAKGSGGGETRHATDEPIAALTTYAKGLVKRYPMSWEQIEHWYNVCRVQFPLYVDYWSKHPDVMERTPFYQEQVFNMPYPLPSGRKVRLRGKWDAVDVIGKGKAAGLYVQENKTKADIREGDLKRQLTFDLQTMLYLVALELTDAATSHRLPILGVRYNVVRRPLGGGKHSIVRHKATKNQLEETKDSYYRRLAGLIAGEPGYYFMRWKVEISKHDVARFRRECLDPLLEQLWDWYETVYTAYQDGLSPFAFGSAASHVHFRYPFGVFNPMNEGGGTDLDNYLETGSTVGLRRVEKLFSELD